NANAGEPSRGATPEPPPAPVSFSTASYRPVDENEITVISKNTVIDGNIRSFANMSIDGNIKGNVETTKDIDLNGKVVGNIACNNAALRTSQIQGNVQMKGNVFMERDTLLIGDISSTYANVNGKIKGNLEITGKAELKSDAVVFGDISASTITVNDGAIIQGYVSTTFLNKEESKGIFPDTITIGE
ncbi:MAG: polymer-forming cytoskeletal protein, partial [Eubacterium sp.]|nr:polymer-forming cytoskeletal protein [Eubacterium sp.]